MLEILVLTACLSKNGCSEVTKAYFEQKPQIKQYVKRKKKDLEKQVGKDMIIVISSIVAIQQEKTVRLRLPYKTTIKLSNSETLLEYRYDF